MNNYNATRKIPHYCYGMMLYYYKYPEPDLTGRYRAGRMHPASSPFLTAFWDSTGSPLWD